MRKKKVKAAPPPALDQTQRILRNAHTLLTSGIFLGSQAEALAEAQAFLASITNQMNADIPNPAPASTDNGQAETK